LIDDDNNNVKAPDTRSRNVYKKLLQVDLHKTFDNLHSAQ